MVVFIDTNILLDVLEMREPHHIDSARVLETCDRHGFPVFMAWHTLATAFYIHSRKAGVAASREALEQLLWSVSIAYTGQLEALRAFQLGFNDLEDALQSVAAEACGAGCIVTRNKQDFTGSNVLAVNPAEFLSAHP